MLKVDWLSQLLKMITVTGRLEVRCTYGAPWRVAWAKSAGHEIPFHVVLKGRALVENSEKGTSRELTSGDILLLPHGAAHVMHDGSGRTPLPTQEREGLAGVTYSENAGAGQGLDMLCGRFLIEPPHDRLIRDYLPTDLIVRTASGDGGTGCDAASNHVANLVTLMREESAGDKLGARTILDALSSALFAVVLRQASQSSQLPPGLLTIAGNQRLAPAISAMFSEPARNWSLPELAALCNMSRATFMRHFRDALGRSTIDFLTDIRMSLAANDLKDSARATEAVAESVGYQSVSSFRRLFAERMGMTAGEWRRLARETEPA